MSDSYYQQRAARRTRVVLAAGAAALVVACAAAAVVALFYDDCTGGFERSPRSDLLAYVAAVARGDVAAAQRCWERDAYYDLETGCSEICLSKAMGAPFELRQVELGTPEATTEGRTRLPARVTIACLPGGEEHAADVVLDSVAGDPPWKHWTIVHSTLGGTVVEPWCR